MTPKVLPDRDRTRKWYLDEDVIHILHNGDILDIEKGYRFNGHSTGIVGNLAVALTIFTTLLYFFPLVVLYTLITASSLLIFSWILVLLFFRAYDTDIRAAIVHDYLIDTMPWHRYSRKFIDHEYKVVMQEVSWGVRKRIMPLAVTLFGFIRTWGWRDYRGEHTKKIKITVSVDMV